MKKKVLLIVSLISIIFSFLFSVPVEAQEGDVETTQTSVNIISLTRKNNTITFVTTDVLDIVSITYEYSFYVDDVLFSKLAHDTTEFTKINLNTYSFEVESNVVGVKLWMVQYVDKKIHPGTTRDDQTTGNNYVGNVNAEYREKWTYINKSDLVRTQYVDHSMDKFITSIYPKYYSIENKLYFSFDLIDPELVTKVEIKYIQYEHIVEPYWIFGKQSHNTDGEEKWYTASIDNNEEYNFFKTALLMLKTGMPVSNEYVEIGVSDREDYQWFVTLPSTRYTEWLYNSSNREVIDSVQIFKISYIDDGVYYEDMDVVMQPTEFYVYKPEKSQLPLWLIILIIILLLILLGLIIKPIIYLLKGVYYLFKYLVIGIYYILKWTIFLPFTLYKLSKEKKEKEEKEIKSKKQKK